MLAGTKKAKLSYFELYQLKWFLGGCLALVSLWTLFYLEVQSGPLLVCTCMAVASVMAFPRLSGRIPKVLWKASTPLLIAVVTVDFLISRPDIIPPLVRMIVMLVLIRTLQYRTRREDLQLVLLCLFIVVISGVLTLSLTFAVQILVFTPCAMTLLFFINITESFERKEGVPSGCWADFRLTHFLARVWQMTDFRMLVFSALIFLGVLAVSSVIFILMPRFRLDQALPFLNLNSKKSLSGFSDSISFGDVVEIIEDDSVALRVDKAPAGSVERTPYWRMVVLDEYYNGNFRMSDSAKAKNRMRSDNFFQARGKKIEVTNDPNAHKWTFYLEGGITRYLPRLGMQNGLRFQNRQDVEFNDRLRVMGTKKIRSSVLFYQLENMNSQSEFAPTEADSGISGLKPLELTMVGHYAKKKIAYPQTTLVIPAGDENIAALTMQVATINAGEAINSQEFSARAVRFLAERHGYSLKSRIPSGEADFLVRWMLSSEPGHCELFSGAFSLLARAAGFPTRVVTGFKGGTWNGYENYYMVRNKDAHAWCEMFDAKANNGQGRWFRVDPTPGSGSANAMSDDAGWVGQLFIDRTWRAYLDSLRILWYRRIVNFDEDQQQELASQIKTLGNDFLFALKAEMRGWLETMRSWITGPWSRGKWIQLGQGLGLLGMGLVLAISLPNLIARLLRRGRLFGMRLTHDPVRRRAGQFVSRFRNALPRVARSPEIPPQEWNSVYRELLALRFGPDAEWPNPKSVFRAARVLLRRAARV